LKLSDSEAVLFHAKRFIIATILYMKGPQTLAQLRKATNLSWGDLDSNIKYLERKGLVESTKIISRKGPRTLVKLTDSGEEAYIKLVYKLSRTIEAIKE
jgi:DNA-binding MarR family transcriptional regulator